MAGKPLVFWILGFILSMLPMTGSAEQRDMNREAEIHRALGEISPEAVSFFKQGTAALDRGDKSEAEQQYRRVLELAPEFHHALRRLSYVVSTPQEANSLANKAFELNDHPHNRMALIQALMKSNKLATAREHADELMIESPNDPDVYKVLGSMALSTDDTALLKKSVDQLQRLTPNEMGTHYFAGLLAAFEEDWVRAEEEIKKAQALGLPAEVAQQILQDAGVADRARNWRLVYYSGYAFITWAAGLMLLLIIGGVLSKLTLSAIDKQDPQSTGAPTGGMATVRKVYKVVMGVTSVYYYISLPIVIFMIIALAGAIIYGFLTIGRIPIKLLIIIAIVALVTIGAMLKSLFIRPADEDPGPRLTEEQAPALFKMLRKLAQKMGTPMVDTVFLTNDANAAVFERGSLWKRMAGKTERCLVIGLGLLHGMTQLQLESILAHEFGHLNNEDTAGGGLALHVRRSILLSAYAMADGGAAAWYNPAWWFVRLFNRIYLLVSQGASRLQEVLADRWAAMITGASAFVAGMQHVVRRSIEFEIISNTAIDNAVSNKQSLQNIFTLPVPTQWGPSQTEDQSPAEQDQPSPEQTIEEAYREAMKDPGSAYDSHPPPGKRIEWVQRIEDAKETVDNGSLAWDLFTDPAELQKGFLAEYDENIRQYHLQQGDTEESE